MKKGSAQHGRYTLVRSGCKCELCEDRRKRDGQRNYEKHKERIATGTGKFNHGRDTRARKLKCPCSLCEAYMEEYRGKGVAYMRERYAQETEEERADRLRRASKSARVRIARYRELGIPERSKEAHERKKEAARRKYKKLQAATSSQASRSGSKYTPEEDSLILTSGLSSLELAFMLGRSKGSVEARKHRLTS